ncbi:MAG: flagellar hook-associated protein FlgK [Acidobacteriia bacterium]|nr:flagellar hook-associated protein FlgK [Terriglobia bacterium]
MGNLLTSLLNNAGALKVFEQALTVTENNVTNANTPGYVRQSMSFEAAPFDLTVGLPGGVVAGPVQSSRDAFAEQAVRDQQTASGYYQQKTADLTPAETYFDLSGTSGLAPSISAMFQSFSQLSVSPNDTVSRQAVLDSAAQVAQNFNHTASGLLSQVADTAQQTRSTIDNINHLAAMIAGVNTENRVDPQGSINAGVDAQLNSDLEQLSQLVNFKALEQPDGTVTVYVGGQTPLVVAGQVYSIQGDFSTPQAAVLSSTGSDISDQITGGQLSALLDDQNNALPSYVNDLNTLAKSLADQVNTALNSGIDQNGAAPVTDLFQYDASTGSALTMAVNPLTADQIAAALPGAPGGNGNAMNLAALANAKPVNGYTFAQFYGNLGGRVGNDLSSAKDASTTKQALLSQAQSLREQVSGVSLDEEAEHLVEYQRSYQAISKMLGVLNSLTDTLMNIIQ